MAKRTIEKEESSDGQAPATLVGNGLAGLLLPACAVIAGFILIGSEFLDTFELFDPDGNVIAVATGLDRHAFALGILGALGIALALASTFFGSRPAALGCAASGLAALVLVGVLDLPDIGVVDLVRDPNGELVNAEAEPTAALWIAAGAALLMTISGAGLAAAQRR